MSDRHRTIGSRLRGLLRLLGQGRGLRAVELPVLGNIEAAGEPGRWRASNDDPQFELSIEGGTPVGLCRFNGVVRQPGHATVMPKFFFGDGERYHELGSQELAASSGVPFRVTLYVPLWCRQIRWDPTVHAGDFQCRLGAVEVLGWWRSLRFLARGLLLPLRLGLARRRWAWRGASAALPASDPTQDVEAYARFLAAAEPDPEAEHEAIAAHRAALGEAPEFAVILAAGPDSGPRVRQTLDSVFAQTHPRWTLLLAAEPEVLERLRKARPQAFDDARLRTLPVAPGTPRETATKLAVDASSSEWLLLLPPDGALAPGTLYFAAAELARAPADLLYGDEDAIGPDGRRCRPVFRSGWNPELLLATPYLDGLLLLRRAALIAAGGLRPALGPAMQYELCLRLTQGLDPHRVRHLPAVLQHRAQGWDAAASGASLDVLRAHLPELTIEPGLLPNSHRVHWPLPATPPKVSILVPTRDGGAHLKVCIDSLFSKTDYPDFELLLIDNQSRDAATLELFEQAARRPQVRVLPYDHAFNFSAINNFAAEQAQGEVLVLLNDDTEVITPGWLRELVGLALRPDVGAVGPKLYFPDGSIQHGAIGLGIGGVAGHLHLGAPGDADGYLGRLKLLQATGAVTGACLAVTRVKYFAVGGLDAENLHVALNDIDFCIKLAERGWRNVWTPHAELVHHESKSRGRDTTPEKQALFRREHGYMRRRWERQLDEDPYYHRHLSRSTLDLNFCQPPRPYRPWVEHGLVGADAETGLPEG